MATDTEIKDEKQLQSADADGASGTTTPPPSEVPSEDERIEPGPTQKPASGGDAGTLSGAPLKDLGDGEDAPTTEVTGATAVKRSATGRKLTDTEQSAALDWLLQADPDPGELETKVLELNFGTQDRPEPKLWEIRPVPLDEMRRIRNKARNSRAARKTGQIDETRMNLEVIVAGTKTPDVRKAAEMAMAAGNGTGDAAEILRARFQSKPGYIAQISAEIMTLSGFDDDDVTEREMVEASGNS